MPDSDSLYHRLFSIPCMVEMLVREFLPQAWVGGLDFSGLRRINTRFHTGRRSARRREGRSLAALLFRLERRLTPKELESLLGEVTGWFRLHPNQGRLQRLFGELVRRACEGLAMKMPRSNDLLEMTMRSNLETIGETWKQQALAEGRAEGRAEGLAAGRAQGKAEALVYLLVERFGALAPSLRTRIHRAKLSTLDRWFKRAIVAPNLSSVFASRR